MYSFLPIVTPRDFGRSGGGDAVEEGDATNANGNSMHDKKAARREALISQLCANEAATDSDSDEDATPVGSSGMGSSGMGSSEIGEKESMSNVTGGGMFSVFSKSSASASASPPASDSAHPGGSDVKTMHDLIVRGNLFAILSSMLVSGPKQKEVMEGGETIAASASRIANGLDRIALALEARNKA